MEPRPADTYHTIESNLETSGSASASSYQMRHPALSSQIQAILSYPDYGLQLDGQDQQDDSFEAFTNTWFGFVQDSHDAALVMEAVIAKHLQAVNSVPGVSMSSIPIQSGTVLVFSESRAVSNNMQRWRDSKRWSPSRPQGPFLLYRTKTFGLRKHKLGIGNKYTVCESVASRK
ncbi:Gti1/Pac2 family-domain-containing protein [Obelidium mucronatum]|nr:Gti1/Pac2 family-domain-containing protein [Obelidium mucronatum]